MCQCDPNKRCIMCPTCPGYAEWKQKMEGGNKNVVQQLQALVEVSKEKSDQTRAYKNNMKLVAITAIKALDKEDIIDLCHSHRCELNHFADVVINQNSGGGEQ